MKGLSGANPPAGNQTHYYLHYRHVDDWYIPLSGNVNKALQINLPYKIPLQHIQFQRTFQFYRLHDSNNSYGLNKLNRRFYITLYTISPILYLIFCPTCRVSVMFLLPFKHAMITKHLQGQEHVRFNTLRFKLNPMQLTTRVIQNPKCQA